jgi:hypothetical protein
MNTQTHKCVLVIDQALNSGTTANVAAILSMSLGNKLTGLIGPDITDRNGHLHPGLTQLPIPVLGASSTQLKEIRQSILTGTPAHVFIVDFNNFAQQAKTYEEYTTYMESVDPKDIIYMGIGLYGDKKTINKATKGLKLVGA